MQTGIPDRLEPKLKADEKLLLEEELCAIATHQLQNFVARRTIGKYGCFGCHDIPGFEDAKPIGTGMAEWGRKDTSKLAFENIHTFLARSGQSARQRVATMPQTATMPPIDGHAGGASATDEEQRPRASRSG